MKLITIDADKLNWMKITGGSLEWVNEVDLCNAIITPLSKEGIWELKANGWYNCNVCNKASAHRTAFCPKCGAKMKGIYND